jgi:hypothetical protein
VTKRRIYRLAPEQEGVPVEGGMFLAEGGHGRCRDMDCPGHGVIISHS